MSNFQYYIGKEAIYLERGCVLLVRVIATQHMEYDGNVGAEFQLLTITEIEIHPMLLQVEANQDDDQLFSVSSVFLEDRNEVVSASGYIVWKLVFNAVLIEKILTALKNNYKNLTAYQVARRILTLEELEHMSA